VFYCENGHGCLRSYALLLCVQPISVLTISAPRSCDRRRIFLRHAAATKTFFRPTCERWNVSWWTACERYPCDRRTRTATSFYHLFDYWTSWLQP
jgi:hypothetical protein